MSVSLFSKRPRNVPWPNFVVIGAALRQPVERAYSNYISLYGRGADPLADFEEALKAEEERARAGWSPHWFYRRNGFYAEQLARYLDVYPRAQLRVCLHEDLKKDAVALMREALRVSGGGRYVRARRTPALQHVGRSEEPVAVRPDYGQPRKEIRQTVYPSVDA